MKVVFIQPNVGFKRGHTWEALGIGYIIAYLKKFYRDGLDVSFFSAFYDSDSSIIEHSEDADIIAFSCTSPQYNHGLYLAKQVKNENNIIIFGGVHPSALPGQVVQESCVDAVVQGEGEQSMLSILNNYSENKKINKKIVATGYIKNIDSIPFPDRTAIKNERNIQQAYKDNRLRITSVLSSRGCPFRCSYCCSAVIWARKIRFRSPENILDEIEEVIQQFQINFLKFSDDTFTINKKRVIDFCRSKSERGITIPFGANAHINTIDEEMLRALSEADCQELWYGVESGSPKILKDMHKNIKIKDIKEKFRLTKEYGIRTRAYFLLGMPNETIEDIHLTEKLCDEIQPDIVGFSLLAPYPKNEYFAEDEMKDWDWSTFDEYTNDWVHTKTMSNADLKKEQGRLIEKYQENITFKQKS
jgi:anaerobic magnesium-protoporphyrin IX monomethyl ester cyclase